MIISSELRCPCFRMEKIGIENNHHFCLNILCSCSKINGGFSNVYGIPILINYNDCDTICDSQKYKNLHINYVHRRSSFFFNKVKKLIYGFNSKTVRNCNSFINTINSENTKSKVLVIGSGTIGQGSEQLYRSSNILITGIDVYPSKYVNYIADAHYLPFNDDFYDGVWIQAVLEHVVDPKIVVNEIHRVLKPNGIVYSEAPFMQQIHEGAYDFYRFTGSAHRALFKNFELMDIGVVGGTATAFAWAFRSLMQLIFKSKQIAFFLSIPLFLIGRFFDKVFKNNYNYDGASGTYFLGQKSQSSVTHKQIVDIYRRIKKIE